MIGRGSRMLLAACVMAALVGRGAAQDRTQDQTRTRDPSTHTGTPGTGDQDRTRDRLKDVLKVDGKLSAQEIDSVGADLDGYLARGGTQERFQAMVRSSLGEGCKGVCLCEAVRSMNQFMSHGQNEAEAQKSLGNILREQNREREQKKLAANDQQRQEQLRQRTMERTRERDRERTREQSGGGAAGTAAGGAPGGAQGGKQGGK
jgi:hypothetical protein